MMNLTLYHTSDDVRVVDKVLTETAELGFVVKQPSNLLRPTILLNYHANLITDNYVYIPEWQRYYYIVEMRFMNGGMVELDLEIDPLMSHKTEIKNVVCTIERQENVFNKYIPDQSVPIRTGRYINEFKVGQLNGSAYVITVNGG